jgi:hypothetical protein
MEWLKGGRGAQGEIQGEALSPGLMWWLKRIGRWCLKGDVVAQGGMWWHRELWCTRGYETAQRRMQWLKEGCSGPKGDAVVQGGRGGSL